MTDIVERLRVYIRFEHPKDYETHIVWQAANEIERLREALRFIVDETCEYAIINKLGDPEQQHSIKLARAALGEGKE